MGLHKFKNEFLSCIWVSLMYDLGFPGGSDGKESACSTRDLGLLSGLERSLGDGNGNRLQYSCLENFMDRAAWPATVQGITKNPTQVNNKHKCMVGFLTCLPDEVRNS